jgi:hypothetical protein
MEIEKFKSIINDIENSPNRELTSAMDFINEDFVKTKNSIINLTLYLDNLEITYNKVLKEYQKRNNGNR